MINPDERKPLILVVNNDIVTLLITEAVLKDAGYAVMSAVDGAEGIAACERFRPNLILINAVMPGMDGFTTIREIRKLPFGEQIPILMLTGLDDIDSVRKAYDVGVTDFVTKPVNWVVLGHRIGYILRANRAFLEHAKDEEKVRALVEAIPDLIFRISGDGTVLDLVSGSEDQDQAEGEGRKVREVIPEAAEQALRCAETARATGTIQRFEFSVDDSREPCHYEARLVALPGGESLFISRDITDRKRMEERLAYMAYHDALTGLPNRVLFCESLEREIANAKRRKEIVGVLLIDLDRFKEVNDTMGHAAGDQLLVLAAERFRNLLRETDTVARFGGDEFCAILPGQTDQAGITEVCNRIKKVFSTPFLIDDNTLEISVSLGSSAYPKDGDVPEILIKKADIAMFKSKSQGRGNYQCFTEEMNQVVTKRIRIEKELRGALERRELTVYYQPEIDLKSGQIVGAEALMRWRPLSGEVITPAEFIPLSEEMGMIVPMSEYVFRTVCLQLKKWHSRGFLPFHVSVNVSARLFRKYDLASKLTAILEEIDVAPGSLELEIAESVAMQNLEYVLQTVMKLNGFSVRIAMDDFGTNHSSLMCFRKFPINLLKIDNTFISELENNVEDQTIVKAIVAMAEALKVDVLAKGVEREEQASILRDFGCRLAQGYHFGHPMPSEDFGKLLEKNYAVGL